MLLAGMAERAVAGVVVDWSGNYFGGNGDERLHWGEPPEENSGGDDKYPDPIGPSDSEGLFISGRAVDDGIPYSPAHPDFAFYGGHAVLSTVETETASRLAIKPNGNSRDELHAEVQPSSTLKKFAMLVYWKVSPTSLGDSSVFSLASKQDAQAGNNLSESGHSLRWVLRNDDTFYISASTAQAVSNNSSYLDVMGSLQWQEYSPALVGFNNGGDLKSLFYTSGAAQDLPFDNVTDVGFYVEYARPTSGINENAKRGVNYTITGFTVNAVPEPSTFLLGLAGFGGVALKRWRKRRESGGTDASQLTEVT